MIFGIVEIPNYLDIDILAYFDVPPATSRDEVRDDDVVAEFEAKTDEE